MFERKYVSQPPYLANFDWTDLDEGTGYVGYYAFTSIDNGTTIYRMSKTAVYTETKGTEATGLNIGGNQKLVDVNFDLLLNVPKTLFGNAIFEVPTIGSDETTGTLSCDYWAVCSINKYDGSTTTVIATNTATNTIHCLGNDTTQQVFNVLLPITSNFHLKAGEYIRCNVQLWITNPGGGGGKVGLMHDPKNGTPVYSGGYDSNEFFTSQLKFYIPYRLLDL